MAKNQYSMAYLFIKLMVETYYAWLLLKKYAILANKSVDKNNCKPFINYYFQYLIYNFKKFV